MHGQQNIKIHTFIVISFRNFIVIFINLDNNLSKIFSYHVDFFSENIPILNNTTILHSSIFS